MYTIEKRIVLHSPIRKVWTALTGPRALRTWMGYGSMIEIDLRLGGSYRFFDGDAMGRFTEIRPPDLLTFTWRKTDWSFAWPDSVVRIELEDCGMETELRLSHSGLPNEETWFDHDELWDTYFLEPMREWAETTYRVIYGVRPLRKA